MQHPSRSPWRHSFATYETDDAEFHGQCVTGWSHLYEQVERRPFNGSITELWLGPIQFFRDQVNQPIAYRGTSWNGSLVFFSARPSPGDIVCSGRQVDQSAIAVWPQNFLQNGFTNGPTDTIALAIDQTFLSRYSARTLGRNIVEQSVGRGLLIVDRRAVGIFHEKLTGLLETVAAQPGCLEDESFCTETTEGLLRMLLELLAPDVFESQQIPRPTTRSYIVDKAVAYMDAHLADPIVISDVCAAVRVCSRTLRYSFEDILGVSPTQYLLARRLSCVRRELKQAGSSTLVYCIAQRYGFRHMGRFANFYDSAFGERPSDTCRRADAVNASSSRATARDKSHAMHQAA